MYISPDQHDNQRTGAVTVAVEKLSGELVRLREGSISEEEFRPTRTILGVYGQRQPEQYMIRVRLPYGAITAPQLLAMAGITRVHGSGVGHVTTRQDMQLHWLPLDAMPEILKTLEDVGLTSLQSGGNSVRNIAACPLAGVCSKEVFDITGHAAAADDHYVGNSAVQSLPRKFKSSFSGCAVDCGLSAIQDFGAIAVERNETGHTSRGFQVYIGGGLGSVPRQAMLLEEFVSQEELLPTYEAVVRTFDRLGDRTRKDRARLKFVVARLGEDELRRMIRQELQAVKSEGLLSTPATDNAQSDMPVAEGAPDLPGESPKYYRWLVWNVTAERSAGMYSIGIALPLGDITSDEMETVAGLLEAYPKSSLRTTAQQGLYVRGMTGQSLPAIYKALRDAGLADLRFDGIADITSCPGTSACSLGIAASKGLARELQQMLMDNTYQDDDALGGLRIKLSGCPDSCSQHQLADIGFCGAALHKNGRLYPAQVMYLGGRVDERGTALGQPVLKLPSRKVPEALQHLLFFYLAERLTDETFELFINRVGINTIRQILAQFTGIPPFNEDASNFVDWDSTRMYILERGEGECSV